MVTSLDFQLHETSVVTGGLLLFEPSVPTVAALLAAAAQAPDEVSGMVNVMKAPPAPFLPAERHGKPIVMALLCFSGRPEEADAVLAPFRAAGTLLADLVRPQPYPEMFTVGPGQNGMQAMIHTGFGFDEAQAATAIELVGTAPTGGAVVNLRPMGGAIARVPAGSTAFAHRHEQVMVGVAAIDPPETGPERTRDWVHEASARLGIAGSKYVNFVTEAGPEAVRDAYPEATLRRLAEIKRTYDPHNLFRSNINIEPAAVAGA